MVGFSGEEGWPVAILFIQISQRDGLGCVRALSVGRILSDALLTMFTSVMLANSRSRVNRMKPINCFPFVGQILQEPCDCCQRNECLLSFSASLTLGPRCFLIVGLDRAQVMVATGGVHLHSLFPVSS